MKLSTGADMICRIVNTGLHNMKNRGNSEVSWFLLMFKSINRNVVVYNAGINGPLFPSSIGTNEKFSNRFFMYNCHRQVWLSRSIC